MSQGKHGGLHRGGDIWHYEEWIKCQGDKGGKTLLTEDQDALKHRSVKNWMLASWVVSWLSSWLAKTKIRQDAF